MAHTRHKRTSRRNERRSRNIASCALLLPPKQEGSIRLSIPERSAAPRTPAGRLIELRRELAYLQRDLDEANAKASRAEEKLKLFTEQGNVSFGGIPAAQIWLDMVLWEMVLNKHDTLRAVFEIGTWEGGFSWWLWAQCEARRMHFETYDAVEPKRSVPGFVRADVFRDAVMIGRDIRIWEPCAVFCDGGNKPRELAIFAEQIEHPDSILLVHDWGTEMLPEHVPASLEMLYGDFCEQRGSVTRVLRKRSENA